MPPNWILEGRRILRLVHVLVAAISPAALYSLLLNYASYAEATPVPERWTSNTTLSNEINANRDNGFQILADGTQDLAALVGLFATDGVERYTIDYTRGLLPPVTAPLSLLGLLGYVRALLKLSLGPDLCERIGFSTTSLRSYAGVKRRDVPQSEKIIEVHYLERTIAGSYVKWNVVKTTSHTQETMPLVSGSGNVALCDRKALDSSSYSIATCSFGSTPWLAFGVCGLCLTLTTSLSSFMILVFPAPWTWARSFACFALPLAVLAGGLPWCWVYITEHIPFQSSDWFRSDWKSGRAATARSSDSDIPGKSLVRKDSFAYFARDDRFYIFDCRAVSVRVLHTVEVASFCAAVCITVAYVCQYIELRSATAIQSAVWLVIQGILAIIRILAWNWAPRVLGFSTEAEIKWIDQRYKSFRDSLTELEITLCWSSAQSAYSATKDEAKSEQITANTYPSLPKWLVSKIDGLRLIEAFDLWNRVRQGVEIESNLHHFQHASEHWDMPDYVFARWLQLRCRAYEHNLVNNTSKRRRGVGAWVCRIIQDMDGTLHMIPGISLHVYPEDRNVTPTDEIIFFSHCRNPELRILCFPRSTGNETQRLYHGIRALPNDSRAMPQVAQRALEPFYQQVVDDLWNEMLSALRVLGFAGDESRSS
ncbi:hypothetical protein BDR22DRAFT_887222 [Usnea florida]